MSIFEKIYIKKFIYIIEKENNNDNQILLESTIKLLETDTILNYMIDIMYYLPLITQKLSYIKLKTLRKVYVHLFNVTTYSNIFNGSILNKNSKNNNHLQYYFYSAILCELVKKNIFQSYIDKTIYYNTYKNDVKYNFIIEMNNKIIECNNTVQKLYNYIRFLYINKSIYYDTISLIQMNNLNIIF